MPAWEKRNIPDEPNGDIMYNQGTDQDWHFVNLKDVHLGKAQDSSMTPGNDRKSIATFAIIAMLILGMAVVNFTNLATARASQRRCSRPTAPPRRLLDPAGCGRRSWSSSSLFRSG